MLHGRRATRPKTALDIDLEVLDRFIEKGCDALSEEVDPLAAFTAVRVPVSPPPGKEPPEPTSAPAVGAASGKPTPAVTVQVTVSTDRMQAVLTVPPGQPRPVELGDLQAALAKAGVCHGIDEDGLVELAEELRTSLGGVKDFAAARGTPTLAGEPASLQIPAVQEAPLSAEALAALAGAVDLLEGALAGRQLDQLARTKIRLPLLRPGQVVAHLRPGVPSKAGTDVTGREVPAPAVSEALPLAGQGLEATGTGDAYVSKEYGYLRYNGTSLSLRSPVWVADDEMAAYALDLDPGQPLVADGLLERLRQEGVTSLPERDWLTAALAADRLLPRAVQVAAGTPPQPGQPARLEMKVDVDCQAGRRREDGSVDHKARNFGFSVEEGSLLAIRWFSTAGKPGTTVCGRAVPPPALTDSPDTRLDAGPGVEMQAQDGSVHYYARMTGNPQRRGSLLQVTPQLDVAGDVDFQTGNIDFNGDLVVKGTVRGGFEVKATGDITVGGGLENGALVKSGGTLTVARGIFGEKTRVAASKGIEAQFVQDASLTCEGDITVAKYIFNGKARAAGWVRVPKGGDKGGIAGGEVCARDGIDTSSAGSEHAAQTRLIAGVDLELARSRQKVEQSLEFCRANVQKLMTALRANSSDPQALNQAVARAAPGQRDRARLLARKLEELAGMAVQLEQERESLDAQQLEVARRARIRVEGTLFPKVEIHLGKAARRTAEAVKRVSLALTQDGQIDLSPLT